ncbi:hypothetical protein [Dokdonia sp.]|uniref:hypothetical protein n=1 Tax=Dokdonia sp. TaxID=2024995 RepID=UPI0032672E0D
MGKEHNKDIQHLKDHLEAVNKDYERMKEQREKAYEKHKDYGPDKLHLIDRDFNHFKDRAKHLNDLKKDLKKELDKSVMEKQKEKEYIREKEQEKDRSRER